MESIPEVVQRRRRIVGLLHRRKGKATTLRQLLLAIGARKSSVEEDLETLTYLGVVAKQRRGIQTPAYFLTDAGHHDADLYINGIVIEPTEPGLMWGILRILHSARRTPQTHPDGRDVRYLYGGPLRALGLRYEVAVDHLQTLERWGVVAINRIETHVDSVRLLAAGVDAVVTGNLSAIGLTGDGTVGQSIHNNIRMGDHSTIGGIAMGGHDVRQHVTVSSGHAELRQTLDELKTALTEMAEDDDDGSDRQHAVNRLSEALMTPEPQQRPVQRAWERVVAFATVEGTIQGGERIGRVLQALAPYVTQWYGGPPPMPPGLMG